MRELWLAVIVALFAVGTILFVAGVLDFREPRPPKRSYWRAKT